MIKMRITYFNNYKDVKVKLYADLTWDEIVDQFSQHQVADDKDDLMFNLITFNQLTDESLPYDEHRTDKRCTENVLGYDGLILDYDGNGATLENIIMRFDGFEYLGYTSYRHILNDEGCEKFRLVFPFTDTCPRDEWEIRKESFLTFAGPEIDRSCVSQSRSFYTPACPPAGVVHKIAWQASGAVLDWRLFAPAVIKPYTAPAVHKPISVTDLQKALDELKKHRSLLPNEDRYWLVRAVTREIGAVNAIVECRSRWPDAQYNGKYEDQVKNIVPKTPGIGRIINEIRKYNPEYRTMSKEAFKLAMLQQKLQQKYGAKNV